MWTILGVVFILALAIAIWFAARGTVFSKSCGCTPNIAKLRGLEENKPEHSTRSEE